MIGRRASILITKKEQFAQEENSRFQNQELFSTSGFFLINPSPHLPPPVPINSISAVSIFISKIRENIFQTQGAHHHRR